jgi:hypothetical protein
LDHAFEANPAGHTTGETVLDLFLCGYFQRLLRLHEVALQIAPQVELPISVAGVSSPSTILAYRKRP